MPFDAGAAVGKLGLDTSGFTGGMLRAEGIAKLFPSVVTSFLANPLLGVIDLAKQAASAIVDMFRAGTDAQDKFAKGARSLGIDPNEWRLLGRVAKLSGSDVETLTQSMRFLQRQQAEAASGNKEAAETFNRWGIAITDTNGRLLNAQQMFFAVSDAIATIPDSANRTQLAMDLLSRGGGSLVDMLQQGSSAIREQMREADLLGLHLSAASDKSAESWNDTIDTIGFAWEDLTMVMAEPIRDSLTPVLNQITEWMRSNAEGIKAAIKEISALVIGLVEVVMELVAGLGLVLEQLEKIGIKAKDIQNLLRFTSPAAWFMGYVSDRGHEIMDKGGGGGGRTGSSTTTINVPVTATVDWRYSFLATVKRSLTAAELAGLGRPSGDNVKFVP